MDWTQLSESLNIPGYTVTLLIIGSGLLGLVFSLVYALQTWSIKLEIEPEISDHNEALLEQTEDEKQQLEKIQNKLLYMSNAIAEGASAFLTREYKTLIYFMVGFGVIIVLLIGLSTHNWTNGLFTMVAFEVGCLTSILSGFVGMKIAVLANSRTCVKARTGYGPAFVTAFKAGCVMGFALTSFGILLLYALINLFRLHYSQVTDDWEVTKEMYEVVAGYGLGGSSIALFGRVGGGIYTKAADVGADLTGKIEFDIPEDDPRNPAVIADNVGDNVGDVAGMGADLFGSFAEASCAAMVVSSSSIDLYGQWSHLHFPLLITAAGILISFITTFFATHFQVVNQKNQIGKSLKNQLIISTVIATPVLFLLCHYFLPSSFDISTEITDVKNWHIFVTICCGLWSGLVIGLVTEYFTSHEYKPTQELAEACQTGAATDIIYGMALGDKSAIIPAFCLAFTVYVSFSLAGMYGISMAALGILSTMAVGLTIDAYGPICDNAGGIAEMSGMGKSIRERTDALDAAGNTTAAIGKGFAIGSAALVALALFGGFMTITEQMSVDVLKPFQFSGLMVGAMLPYWFTALTLKSVGKAALEMVREVRRQFTEKPQILEGTIPPDYGTCVDISTRAALLEMLAPGALVILTPLIVGFFFGVECLAGVLAGSLVSGVQRAVSAANAGGAWDNAKKYIECGEYGGKGSESHKAAVVGDTVGDPFKDTSGPSLNILIKLSAIISLVFARSFPSVEKGGLIVQFWREMF